MIRDIIDDIKENILDARNKGFDFSPTTEVPNINSSGLTYESGDLKKGKIISTCVLFVDIRDSVKLVQKHHTDTIGKLYTAFVKSILKISVKHGGKVRNISGDRVMIIFPETDCFVNSINCAISINHIANEINNIFNHVDFKCGIGIDYGEMKAIKVGIEKKGHENRDYKDLVWIGHPANKASRLTDIANKKVTKKSILFKYKPLNWAKILGFNHPFFGNSGTSSIYLENSVDKEIELENIDSVLSKEGSDTLSFSEGKLIEYKQKETSLNYKSILVTESVYLGYKRLAPNSNSIKNNWWKEISSENIKDIEQKIYGANLVWKLN